MKTPDGIMTVPPRRAAHESMQRCITGVFSVLPSPTAPYSVTLEREGWLKETAAQYGMRMSRNNADPLRFIDVSLSQAAGCARSTPPRTASRAKRRNTGRYSTRRRRGLSFQRPADLY